jgi:hypothetical protein
MLFLSTEFYERKFAMARPEVSGKKIVNAENGDGTYVGPLDAYSIEAFCQRHSISIAFYYKLRAKDPPETPREMEVGARVLITKESAADWRREREAATAKQRERKTSHASDLRHETDSTA